MRATILAMTSALLLGGCSYGPREFPSSLPGTTLILNPLCLINCFTTVTGANTETRTRAGKGVSGDVSTSVESGVTSSASTGDMKVSR